MSQEIERRDKRIIKSPLYVDFCKMSQSQYGVKLTFCCIAESEQPGDKPAVDEYVTVGMSKETARQVLQMLQDQLVTI